MNLEKRYTLLKDSDVGEALDADECTTLINLVEKVEASRANRGKPPLSALVLESDWPEYEPARLALIVRILSGPKLPPPIIEGTAFEQAAALQLQNIGQAIGYGRSCQILGYLWDAMLSAKYGFPPGPGRGSDERRPDIEIIEKLEAQIAALTNASKVPAFVPSLEINSFADPAIGYGAFTLGTNTDGSATTTVEFLVRPLDVRGDEAGMLDGLFVQVSLTREELHALAKAADDDWQMQETHAPMNWSDAECKQAAQDVARKNAIALENFTKKTWQIVWTDR